MKFSLLLLWIFNLYFVFWGQNPEELANYLEKKGDIYGAITEYERAYFFTKNSDYMLKVINLYRKIGEYKNSNNLIDYIFTQITDLDKLIKLQIIQVSNDIILNDFSRAELILERIPEKYKRKYSKIVNIQYIFIYLATNREMKALTLVSKIKKDHIKEFVTKFKKIYEKKYNENYIKFMSTIIPGSGQILVGKYLSGIDAMLLNGAIFYLWGDLILKKNYFDFFIYFFSLQRYYTGQRNKAVNFTKKYNQQIREKLIELTKEYLKGCG